MEDNFIVKVSGDERFPEVIGKLGLLGKEVRISYRWGISPKYVTGKVVEATPQFLFIKRKESQSEKVYCFALREIIGFRQIFDSEGGGDKRD